MRENKSVLFVGVGGQGTILASKILTEGLLKSGYDVKMSEVHGMAKGRKCYNTSKIWRQGVFSINRKR